MKEGKIKVYNIIHQIGLWRTHLNELSHWEEVDEIAYQALDELLKQFRPEEEVTVKGE